MAQITDFPEINYGEILITKEHQTKFNMTFGEIRDHILYGNKDECENCGAPLLNNKCQYCGSRP